MKKNCSKAGFTLIELLAVIAILAILLIIAIPSVIKLYNNAKKNTFVDEVQSIINTAEKQYMSDQMSKDGVPTCYSNVESIKTEKGCHELDLSGNNDLDYFINYSDGLISNVMVNDGEQSASINNSNGKVDASSVDSESIKAMDEEGYKEITPETIVSSSIVYTPESCFIISSGTASLDTSNASDDCKGEIVIPNKIDGQTVTGVSGALPNVTSVSVPGTVTTLNSCTFAGSSNLQKIILNEGTTTIGNSAFGCGMNSLSTVVLPSTITSIGSNAFASAPITSINLPEGLLTIAADAFNGAHMTSVTIPSTVTSIGDSAFRTNASYPLTKVCARGNNGSFTYNTEAGSSGTFRLDTGASITWNCTD